MKILKLTPNPFNTKKAHLLNDCCFCLELLGNSNTDFFRIYQGNPSTRFIAQTKSFVIIPTIGQLIEGYLLIVTKKHYTSMGHLTAIQLNELEEVKQKISIVLSKTYGKPIFFEHGSAFEGIGGCGVYHAHLHVVPVGETISLLDDLRFLEGYKIETLGSLVDRINSGKSYLFYEDQKSVKYIFNEDGIPSQFFRKILAKQLGKTSWDWRNFGREREVIFTLKKLGTFQDTLNKVKIEGTTH